MFVKRRAESVGTIRGMMLEKEINFAVSNGDYRYSDRPGKSSSKNKPRDARE